MLKIKLTKRQYVAIQHLCDSETRAICWGGAKGGGKSFLLCHWVHYWCHELCNLFSLESSDNPLPLGFIGRKRAIDFKKTTLETWKRVIPIENYIIKEQAGEIVLFENRCKILFGGLDSQESVQKFNSMENCFHCIDQAEETTREDVAVLRGALRLKVNGIQPVYKELYTANPSDCWLKEDFVDHKLAKHVYIPALPSDNPHLPDNYIETLEAAFKHSQPLLRAYRDGDWSALKSTNTLLSSDDIKKLEGITIHYPKDKRVIICDPATTHDECVIYCLHNYEIIEQNILTGETDEMKIAGQMAVMAKKHNCLDVGGDSIGLGSGIFARLQEMGEYRVHRINSSESSFSRSFTNKRAEIYWNLMRKVIDKQIPYPKDEELRRQLINTTYEVIGSNGEIKITQKDKIKKVIGRSPDRADAFAMGIWLSDQVEPYTVKVKSRTIYFETSNDDVMETVV